MSLAVRSLFAETACGQKRKIERVPKSQKHTVVIKQGGATACLRINDVVTAGELLDYCDKHLGWNVKGQPFIVDGRRFGPGEATSVKLHPETEKVVTGVVDSPRFCMEVKKNLGAKG